MAAVVRRTFSSSSTTRMRCPAAPAPLLLGVGASGICLRVFRERRRVHGQDDGEGGALALRAHDLDAPAVVPDDVLRHPQAEARALRARREERLEDARHVLLADADAGVADVDGDGRLERLVEARRAHLDLAAA